MQRKYQTRINPQALKADETYWKGNKINVLQGLSKGLYLFYKATSTLATAVIDKIKESEKEEVKKRKKSKKSRSRSRENREGKRRRSRSEKKKKSKVN